MFFYLILFEHMYMFPFERNAKLIIPSTLDSSCTDMGLILALLKIFPFVLSVILTFYKLHVLATRTLMCDCLNGEDMLTSCCVAIHSPECILSVSLFATCVMPFALVCTKGH